MRAGVGIPPPPAGADVGPLLAHRGALLVGYLCALAALQRVLRAGLRRLHAALAREDKNVLTVLSKVLTLCVVFGGLVGEPIDPRRVAAVATADFSRADRFESLALAALVAIAYYLWDLLASFGTTPPSARPDAASAVKSRPRSVAKADSVAVAGSGPCAQHAGVD
jgi:hypothetical protein